MNNTNRPHMPASTTPAPVLASFDPQLIERFSRLMASRDWPVESPRMLRDSAYAYKRLAIAFSSGDAALKAMSLTLFEGYQAQERRRQRAES